VEVDVCVAVGDMTMVGVVGMSVAGDLVFVGFGFDVDVGVHGINTNVLVRLGAMVTVLVADEAVVGAEDVDVEGGNGVPVMTVTPGVRKSSFQPGFVRMAASMGSMKPLGLRVRKSLLGSM
jgi:hypothetical protein